MFGQRLVDIATSFPTVVYSIGFGVSLVYWLFVLLGALDMPGADGLEGGGKLHFGDAAGGKIGLEGLAAKGGSVAFVRPERAVRVPITVYASIALALTWMFSCLGIELLDALGTAHLAFQLLVLVLAPLLGFGLARPLTHPLGRFFGVHAGQKSGELRGKTALVTTGRVDQGFGQARVEAVNADLLVQVRANPNAKIVRGQRVLLLDFDEQTGAFDVEPMSHVLGQADMTDTDTLVPSETEPALRAGSSQNE